MDVDMSVGTSLVREKEYSRQRRRLQLKDAIRRRQRNLMLDQQAKEAGLNYVLPHALPAYEDGNDATESQLLLAELTAHHMRQRGRATLAEELAARGQEFLELRPDEGNPFGDTTRILLDAGAGLHTKVKEEPVVSTAAGVSAPAPVKTPSHPATPVRPVPQAASATPYAPSPSAHAHASPAANGARPAGTEFIRIPPIQRSTRAKGLPALPQVIDGFKIYSTGRFPEQREFFEAGVIFAPGYRVTRSAGAGNVVPHTCEILNREGGPLFKIFAEDTKQSHESYSIIDAWTAIGRPAFELRGYHCNETAEAALDFFGLSVPRIRKLLEELAPPEANLEAFGVTRHSWQETPSVADDPDFALRTVETSLVRVPSTQAIETVIKPPVSPPVSQLQNSYPAPFPTPGSRRGSHQSDTLSPAISAGRRYSANAEELAKGYPASYGSPVPGAGMLIPNASVSSSSPQMSRFSSASSGPAHVATGHSPAPPTAARLSPQSHTQPAFAPAQ